MSKSIVCFVIFLGFYFMSAPASFADEEERIVYFTDELSAREFANNHSEYILSIQDGILNTKGLSSQYLSNQPNIELVEPNHAKHAASFAFNDPLINQQWYLNKINFQTVGENFPASYENLFLNKPLLYSGKSTIYTGQPIAVHPATFTLGGETVNRVSVTLKNPGGSWTLTVQDSSGKTIGVNSGTLSKLDVLIEEQSYETLTIKISTDEDWQTAPLIERVTGVNHVRVGVLDSGISPHEDFCENLLFSLGKDYKSNQPLPYDGYGHGTHVAGIIGACSNNGIGVSGTSGNAPLDIIPFKVLNDDGLGGDFEISQAIEDAIEMNVDIVNLSLAGRGTTLMLENTIKKAYLNQVLVIAAAGNYNTSTESVYPASYPFVMAVSALNEKMNRVANSDFGWEVDISAPGEGILSTFTNNSYKELTGTSMATPLVTAAAALVLENNPSLDITGLRGALYDSTNDILTQGYDIYSGAGMINYSKIYETHKNSKLEWLNAKEGQPHLKNSYSLGISQDLRAEELYVFSNEKVILHQTIDSNLEDVVVSPSSSKPTTKILTLAVDDGIVSSMDYTYLLNTDAAQPGFKDIPTSYWAFNEITQAADNGYIHGHDDGYFRPHDYISRRHATMMMNRLFRWEDLKSLDSPFTDVGAEITPSNIAMLAASSEGIIKGYPDKHFYPENSLTRGQMALVLARALNVDSELINASPHHFKDVSPGSETFIPITNLTELGIITKQELYKPVDNINRAQFAAMVNRTHDYLANKTQ
ncbi:S8 family peptidase [Bacillus sp. AK031]